MTRQTWPPVQASGPPPVHHPRLKRMTDRMCATGRLVPWAQLRSGGEWSGQTLTTSILGRSIVVPEASTPVPGRHVM